MAIGGEYGAMSDLILSVNEDEEQQHSNFFMIQNYYYFVDSDYL